MQKIGIAICGSSGIDYVDPNHGMKVFRSKIQINAIEYVDYVDISNEQFYFLLYHPYQKHKILRVQYNLVLLYYMRRSWSRDAYEACFVILF